MNSFRSYKLLPILHLLFWCLMADPSPPLRHRASHVKQNKLDINDLDNRPGLEAECEMRAVAYTMAMRIPTARKHSLEILESLNASECDHKLFRGLEETTLNEKHYNRKDSSKEDLKSVNDDTKQQIFLNCEQGSDDNNGLSKTEAVKTVHQAQSISWQIKGSSEIIISGGICQLHKPLVLTENDSHRAWKAVKGEEPIFSGGVILTNLPWKKFTRNVFVTDLPKKVNASAIDSMFALRSSPSGKPTIRGQSRLVRARFPNGNCELDRMPRNYAKLGGSLSSVEAWRIAGNQSQRFSFLHKNSSFYPWFGHSKDTRWTQDYHLENRSSYFDPNRQFWQPNIATSVKYNNSWTGSDLKDSIIHVIHYDWWGNWQWRLTNLSTSDSLIFGEGGWQDAHGGPVIHNYFFLENLLQELDSPGEWFVDKENRKLYYWPIDEIHSISNPSSWKLVASQLATILSIRGGGKINETSFHDNVVRNISLEGITFAHSTPTFLHKQYSVPSAGDWSVLPQGAVTLSNGASDIMLRYCRWVQVDGNAVALYGFVHNSSISDGDFIKLGDSGVVSVGYLDDDMPYSGINVSSVPTNITIARCHFGQVGVYGKQVSALFVALSKRITFVDNVLYDGPRAGININDGFSGGHQLRRNVIFNQVLESGDHGPINTWSRSAYLQKGTQSGGKPSSTPEWNYIQQNFILLGPKFGSHYGPGNGPCSNGDPHLECSKGGGSLFSCLDHDDGSEYYLDTQNVCAFFGMKNYIGQNKVWDSNLIIYPEGSLSQNRSGMPCLWTSMNMATKNGEEKPPCSNRLCRTREVFTNNSCVTRYAAPLEYDMFNETDLAVMGNRNTTIPYTAYNRYYLKNSYKFRAWDLSQAQAHGIDAGSREYPEHRAEISRMACQWLDLVCPWHSALTSKALARVAA
mmetsp:Transcript_23494/g.34669  ORF Transcript_23494/g.34669 Transcript_23494/m.34669 type:complete len:913 (-) Transcript_23494:156-2894(-)|eukprot:CAMPEP_0194225184 /NCGR_PEP_ID=MMETSP0156-20130528/38976_1 /TAXON_ID=33649 /ORGANISM="Thalassionema nitzschioides, Strain L26-B" /LENGTH=912 /DNA_ID=CAMNT_0038957027 /DNA_START=190 /DNA_END=2928 /DNA_ORIENTATION=+